MMRLRGSPTRATPCLLQLTESCSSVSALQCQRERRFLLPANGKRARSTKPQPTERKKEARTMATNTVNDTTLSYFQILGKCEETDDSSYTRTTADGKEETVSKVQLSLVIP